MSNSPATPSAKPTATATPASEPRKLDPDVLVKALEMLRERGNPFRQQFARNSDDPTCARFHVQDLFAHERSIMHAMVESYRARADRPTAVLPLLGPRGAGKTHLLHCLKHGPGVAPTLFVTPGTFRVDAEGDNSSFLEYLLYQMINVLLSGNEQRGVMPLSYVSEQLTRRVLLEWLRQADPEIRRGLVPSGWSGKMVWGLGLGRKQALEQVERFANQLTDFTRPVRKIAEDSGLDVTLLLSQLGEYLTRTQPRDLKGDFRRRLVQGCVHVTLAGDEAPLAEFLTDGFVDVPFEVKPSRSQLTLSLLQALTEVIVGSGIPVTIAFDQLEELLYGRTEDEIRRSSDAFFGGIVQAMSQIPGLSILLFVEEGLWNRIVPPLPSHILDRIHEPLHLPPFGTVRTVHLSTPSAEQLAKVVRCRVQQTLLDQPLREQLPADFPFGIDYLTKLTRQETVLRLMLQACCNRLDELFEKPTQMLEQMKAVAPTAQPGSSTTTLSSAGHSIAAADPTDETGGEPDSLANGLDAAANADPTTPPVPMSSPDIPTNVASGPVLTDLTERWAQEVRSAARKLKPVGALAAATEDIQSGMARWLRQCCELGVQQDRWRMAEIIDPVKVGDHPTYGSLTVVRWQAVDPAGVPTGDTVDVGIALWLGRGPGKPRDLQAKLAAFDGEEPPIDYMILFRPDDDVRMSGRTRTLWDATIEAGHMMRMEAIPLDIFAVLYAFPRWLRDVHEVHPAGTMPDALASFLAEQTAPIMQRLGLPIPNRNRGQAA